MAKKDSSYDERLYEGNRLVCWGFGISYILATLVSFFQPLRNNYLDAYGIAAVAFSLYEITRAHSNIGNIVERYRNNIHDLEDENHALKNKINELERKIRYYD